ncbi:integrating conjugative element protein (TIGR03765 family) [Pseudomonas sp. JUb42]|uniref:integrating conjugative element protein n=1 Tax=Pseudomonas sp. JUb42 TaxID=2940611 RepID=UPI0038F5EB85|nr:integrating conjugative element protein (TIGR03765 family) [Pseudomonas sp. JUb42]
MNKLSKLTLIALMGIPALPLYASPLIVVDDRGGDSALPYYRGLNPQPATPVTASPIGKVDVSKAQGLPVRSTRLSPGTVQGRVINAPGLTPFFLVGDDEQSRLWLTQHADALRQMQAMGLVVNVASSQRLAVIQGWITGVRIAPTPGDDLAQRLALEHYPALITATAIEQ